jgi:hypothetical protein
LKARPESCAFEYRRSNGWLRKDAYSYYYYDPKAGAPKKALALITSKLLGLAIIGR